MRWIFKKDLNEGKSVFYHIEKAGSEVTVSGRKWSFCNDNKLCSFFTDLQENGYKDLNLHDYTEEEIQEMISESTKHKKKEDEVDYVWIIDNHF